MELSKADCEFPPPNHPLLLLQYIFWDLVYCSQHVRYKDHQNSGIRITPSRWIHAQSHKNQPFYCKQHQGIRSNHDLRFLSVWKRLLLLLALEFETSCSQSLCRFLLSSPNMDATNLWMLNLNWIKRKRDSLHKEPAFLQEHINQKTLDACLETWMLCIENRSSHIQFDMFRTWHNWSPF